MNKIYQLHHDNAQRTRRPANVVKNGVEASLYIYDIIDEYWGVSAASVVESLAMADGAETLNVYINSPGGSVFESRAIMAALQRFPGKTVAHIDSLCASAATSIALSCSEVNMSAGALFMVHNASGMAYGDKQAMRDTADLLQKVELSIIKDYTNKTGKSEAEVIAWMDAETWMTATEALANGFIDNVVEPKSKAKNTWNLAAYKNAPEAITKAEQMTASADDLVAVETRTFTEKEIPSMTTANANRLRLSLI